MQGALPESLPVLALNGTRGPEVTFLHRPREWLPDAAALDGTSEEEVRAAYFHVLLPAIALLGALAIDAIRLAVSSMRLVCAHRSSGHTFLASQEVIDRPVISPEAAVFLHLVYQCFCISLVATAKYTHSLDLSTGMDFEWFVLWLGMVYMEACIQVCVRCLTQPLHLLRESWRKPATAATPKVLMSITPGISDRPDLLLDWTFVVLCMDMEYEILSVVFTCMSAAVIMFSYSRIYVTKAFRNDLMVDHCPHLMPKEPGRLGLSFSQAFIEQEVLALARPIRQAISKYEDLPQALIKLLYGFVQQKMTAFVVFTTLIAVGKAIFLWVSWHFVLRKAGNSNQLLKKLSNREESKDIKQETVDKLSELLGQAGDRRERVQSELRAALALMDDDEIELVFRSCSTCTELPVVLIGTLGRGPAAEIALKRLEEDIDEWVQLVACVAIIQEEPKAVDLIERILAKSKNVDEQIRAMKALGKVGAPWSQRAMDSLLPRMKFKGDPGNPLIGVGLAAAEAFAVLAFYDSKESKVAVELLQSCTQSSDKETRYEAAKGFVVIVSLVESLRPLLQHEDAAVRKLAASVMAQLGEPSWPANTGSLGYHIPTKEEREYVPFGEANSQRAVDLLLPLLSDDDAEVRQAASEAIGKIALKGSQPVVDQLKKVAQDKNEGARKAAVEAIGKFAVRDPSKPELEVLLEALQQAQRRKDVTAFGAAVQAFVQIMDNMKDKSSQMMLKSVLKDENVKLREAAVKAIGERAEKGSQEALPLLRQALKDKETSVRTAAAKAIGDIAEKGSQKDLDLLLQMVGTSKDSGKDVQLRCTALEAIGKIAEKGSPSELFTKGSLPVLNVLGPMLLAGGRVREAAMEAFLRIAEKGSKAALDPLRAVLIKIEDVLARRDAVKAMGMLGFPEESELLMTLLQDKEEELVQIEALVALRRLGAEGPEQVFLRLEPYIQREGKKSNTRERAVEAVGEIFEKGSQQALGVLGPLLQDESMSVRLAAVQAIAAVADEASQPALKLLGPLLQLKSGAMEDGSHYGIVGLCVAAVEAIGKVGGKGLDSVGLISPLLRDANEKVREAAVKALGEIAEKGSQADVQLLELSLKDKDGKVRRAAVEAIGEKGSQAGKWLLRPLLQDKDSDVRQAAVKALDAVLRPVEPKTEQGRRNSRAGFAAGPS